MIFDYEEYEQLGGYNEVTVDNYSELLSRAKRMVDSQVGYDVEDQHKRGFISDFAFKFYKSAIVAQIEYIHFVGIKQIAGMNETQNVKIGNFSYSEGVSRGGAIVQNPQFSNQVFEYLSAGGFLGGPVMTYGN